ncbi:thioesterase II family protein [Paractinoplanes abujensis]|uniref:Surfactin synthase thioesterase subunit n=1 Tax=Paractinoplanes abujensis TaxID=882441 RepID=A0A7W7CJZ4_9ACTN|nr:alpha/beta fold hydrolase [Actinoplanes abujensis]MBB4689969.1 surfactin synthase thioesterase subunit [Actinoplanes abujensis]
MSRAPRTGQWIQPFGVTRAGGPRLVCFPHAGGSASFYHPLAVKTAGAEVLAVQYPGRQERRTEKPFTDLGEMADRIHAELASPAGSPLILFGHSMGAVLAYEVARRLESDGARPLGVIVSGRRAPSVRLEETVHLRGDRALLAEVRQLSGTAAALLDDEEVVQMILPALRADYRAIETYQHRPGAGLTCPITALTGDSDPRAALDHVRAWDRHTTGGFDLRTFPGGHFYLTTQWAEVAAAIHDAITAFSAPAR